MADSTSVTYSRSDNQKMARTRLKNSSFDTGTMPTHVENGNSFPVQLHPNSYIFIRYNFVPDADWTILQDLNQMILQNPVSLGSYSPFFFLFDGMVWGISLTYISYNKAGSVSLHKTVYFLVYL